MLTVSEIESAIAAKYSWSDDFWEDLYRGEVVRLLGIPGEISKVDFGGDKEVDSYGDFSGPVWMVVQFGQQTFRVNGYYDSYGGAVFDGALHEVEAETRVIQVTEWKAV